MSMPARYRAEWAKEELLGFIDASLTDRLDSVTLWDERDELQKQRNRVAKFLGLPEKKYYK